MKVFALLLFVFAAVSLTVAAKDPICDEPPKSGGQYVENCLLDMPSWSYDSSEGKCVPYLYGGCVEPHNNNFFSTEEECQEGCIE